MSLASIAMSAGRTSVASSQKVANIIEFIESPWGLNMKPFPVQRVILKAYYGIPLDDDPDNKSIHLTGWRRNEDRWMTEAEYLRYLYDEGRSNVREVTPGHERLELVLSIGRRAGKCVTGDTLVLTDRGVLPIAALGDPFGAEFQPVELTVSQEGGRTSAAAYFYNGSVQDTFKVETADGGLIEGTAKHQVRVMGEDGTTQWRRFDQIQNGEFVCIPVGTRLWASTPYECPQTGATLTYDLARSLGGCLRGRKPSKALVLFVSTRVPMAVLRSPENIVGAFLEGVFGELRPGASAKVRSLEAAQDLRVLLLNMGYPCTLVKRKKSVDVTILSFSDLSIPYQQAWVERLVASVDLSSYSEPVQQMVEAARRGEFASDFTALFARLGQICTDADVREHFRRLFSSSCIYMPVVKVSRGIAPVYDLNVPDGHEFVAGGFVNHNTTMSSFIAAYETYRLLNKGDPQKYYGLPPSNTIQLISVATDKEQAGLLYQEVSGHFKNTAFFSGYAANSNQSQAKFQTPHDIERYGSWTPTNKAKATIKITFRSCVAKGLRGAGNIVIILDEVAHFNTDGQSSAEEVYNAVTPSAAAYSPKDPNDKTKAIGSVESKIINISSPLGRQGLFYKLYQDGFATQTMAAARLCIQAPTWEVNPSVEAAFFEGRFLADPRSFDVEFGASFSDRTRGWIADAQDLLDCVKPNMRPAVRAPARQPHFAGIDVALVGDYTTIAIGHIDDQNRIVADLVTGIRAGDGDFASYDRLEFSMVADWIYQWTRQFYIVEGLFDQWLGIPLEQALQAKGLNQFTSFKSSPQISSQMFKNFMDLMLDKKLVLYDWPIQQGEAHCTYIQELLELQAEYKSKYVTLVQAPQVAGKHDDHADALVRMVWSASNNMAKYGGVAEHRQLPGHGGMSHAAMRRKMLQMGSSPDRQAAPGGVALSRAGYGLRSGGGGGGISGVRGRPSALELSITPPWRRGR